MNKEPNIPSKKLTIKDIADMAGVSQTAVSFVINDRRGVSPATREKIKEIMKATNYVPNISSRRLMMRRSFNVALLYPAHASPFSDLFYSEIAGGLTQCLMESCYNVVLSPLNGGQHDDLPGIIQRNDADGAVIFQDARISLPAKLDEMALPYVYIDLQEHNIECIHVSLDSEALMGEAVGYLARMGHNNIAFLGSDQVPNYYQRCYNAYKKALVKHGLNATTEWVCCSDGSPEATEKAIGKLFAYNPKPTAICCISDMVAIYAINALKKLGASLPKDMSIIGVDDILISPYVEPALTCVTYDKWHMGYLAGELLVALIDKKPVESHILSNFKIRPRQSVYDMKR